jgi:uncharacterized membrane protein
MPDDRETLPRRPTTALGVLKVALAVAMGASVVAYPLVIYGLLTSGFAAHRLLWLAVPVGLSLWISGQGKSRGARLTPVLAALALILAGFALETVQPLLFVPVVVNGVLLFSFASTLWTERPLIERFARLQDEDLTAAEVAWCRTWTSVWSVFFAVNVAMATGLGLAQKLHWWALYNGLFAYIIMGCLFGSEYTLRKYRFGRYRPHPLDRFLQWCFERRRRP